MRTHATGIERSPILSEIEATINTHVLSKSAAASADARFRRTDFDAADMEIARTPNMDDMTIMSRSLLRVARSEQFY